MKTKEEILKAAYEKKFAAPRYESSVNREAIRDYVLPAMEEYAKQQVIEEVESLLSRCSSVHPEYIMEILYLHLSELKSTTGNTTV